MKQPQILIVDDDRRILDTLGEYLRGSGLSVVTAGSGSEALRLNNANIDLVLLDLVLPDTNGIELLQEFRSRFTDQVVIMISGAATLTDAIRAVKLGAADFLEKPVSPEKVEICIRNILKTAALEQKLNQEQQKSLARFTLVGESAKIEQVKTEIKAVSETDSVVLLLGESGTGKEIVANLIHLHSKRQLQPFIAINAAAVPGELIESEMFGHEKGAFTGAVQRRIGKFEQAGSGTLLLDEIAEMPPLLQAKLLRVLEEHTICRVGGSETVPVDFRLICATNRNLTEEIRKGSFRRDLFFRINVFSITLPSLREIPEDIGAIARHHLGLLSAQMGKPQPELPDEFIALLQRYHFPGNVRELRNILEHLLIITRTDQLPVEKLKKLLSPDLVLATGAQLPLKEAVAQFEREYIEATMNACGGNISKAAASLDLDRSYLYRKMKQLGLG
ncbi:MAG: sigma-54-dependent Fis family transcriptional regulator [candidate division Zixibacteria bacterium]|nr:sigma-54-dependent Fis family transcriptional regulator [candidate division Zixibacteria bacterium]